MIMRIMKCPDVTKALSKFTEAYCRLTGIIEKAGRKMAVKLGFDDSLGEGEIAYT